MKRESSTDIDAAAARWAARVDRGLTSDERVELEAWAAADTRRLGALARAQAVLAHCERARALGPRFAAVPPRPARRAFVGGLLAAGLAAVVTGVGLHAWTSGGLRTAKGEVRLVPLTDGSSMTLNTASRVRVEFTDGLRAVDLLEGEALFDVAKDARRPFLVRAGATTVRAVGTSFTVRRLADDSVRVVVREGTVEIRQPRNALAPVRASANVAVTSRSSGDIASVAMPPAELSRQLAWREGMLAFDGVPIAAAAAEFARYSDTRIVVEDPRLAAETITGLFSANDPRGFAKAVALSLDARVTSADDRLYLSR